MTDSKILITGAAGMVGSHLVEYYAAQMQPHQIIGSYFSPTVKLSDITDLCLTLELDVTQQHAVEKVIHEFKPRIIYHLAAQSFPTVSWEKPLETIDINVNGTINLFEAIRSLIQTSPDYDPVVIVACSSAQYGYSLTPENTPIDEHAELLPLHPYGVSKVAQDLLTWQYFKSYGIRGIRARIFNTTGPRKTHDAVSDFVRRALDVANGKCNRLKVGNLKSRRAITDVRDLVKALVLLSEKGVAGEAYNISGDIVYSMQEVIETIELVMRRNFELENDNALLRPTDEPIIYGNSEKLKQHTGWRQQYDLKQTISDMINYMSRS